MSLRRGDGFKGGAILLDSLPESAQMPVKPNGKAKAEAVSDLPPPTPGGWAYPGFAAWRRIH